MGGYTIVTGTLHLSIYHLSLSPHVIQLSISHFQIVFNHDFSLDTRSGERPLIRKNYRSHANKYQFLFPLKTGI